MSAATALTIKQQTSKLAPAKPERRKRPMTFEQFLKKYSAIEDGYKYEWNDGKIEKYPKMLVREQIHILHNLQDFMYQTTAFKNGGRLVQELKTMTSDSQMRFPDIAFYTFEQYRDMTRGAEIIADFMVEVISTHDKAYVLAHKNKEYFKAGAKVVWHIYPNVEMIAVFTSPLDVKLCEGEMLCSAEPVIDGFVIAAQDVFRKP
jgi:Uma2 family endonuclease